MIRSAALMSLVGAAVILTACGQPEPAAPARDGAEVTATYEAAKAQILQSRRGTGPQTPTAMLQQTPTTPRLESTKAPNPTATAQFSDATVTVSGVDEAAPLDIMTFFPTDAQLPAEFGMWKDVEASLDEATATNSDPVAHRQRFADWGFRRLHSRGYELPHSLTITDRMNIFFVTVYAWGSPEQAAAAAAFNLKEQSDCYCWTNVEPVTIPDVGDEVTGMTADPVNADGFHISMIYIRFGAVVVRVEAHASSVDPLPEAVAFVHATYGSR